jgi:hypothetical protein
VTLAGDIGKAEGGGVEQCQVGLGVDDGGVDEERDDGIGGVFPHQILDRMGPRRLYTLSADVQGVSRRYPIRSLSRIAPAHLLAAE